MRGEFKGGVEGGGRQIGADGASGGIGRGNVKESERLLICRGGEDGKIPHLSQRKRRRRRKRGERRQKSVKNS